MTPTFRRIIPIVAIAVLATVGVVAVVTLGGEAPVAVVPADTTTEVAVERGDIVVTESVDGTVEETDTITIVHRIDGQTTTATNTQDGPADSSTGNAGALVAPVGLVSPDLSISTSVVEVVGAVAMTETVAISAAISVETPPDTTVPDTTVPEPAPPSTEPASPETSTPSTEPAPPETSMPIASSGSGGNPTAGGAPSGGAPTSATGGSTAAPADQPISQVVTGISHVGTEIVSGDVLYTVDGQPVVALAGALPAWRTMDSSSGDGPDIAQLEAALVAIGYDPTGEVTVDGEWDSDTTALVERWQVGLGVDDTGAVTLGSIVFIPHPAAVSSTTVTVGDEVENGDTVMLLAGTVQQVIIEVPIELRADLAPSMRVDIEGTPGTITRLRSADGTNGVTVQAVIAPDAPLDVEAGATQTVTITLSRATDQLVVPTEAIVSRLDGTYAVESLDAAGVTAYITVDVVAVSGNRTAVTGDGLDESTIVVAPG